MYEILGTPNSIKNKNTLQIPNSLPSLTPLQARSPTTALRPIPLQGRDPTGKNTNNPVSHFFSNVNLGLLLYFHKLFIFARGIIENTPSVQVKCLRFSVTLNCNLTWVNPFYQRIYMPAPTTF